MALALVLSLSCTGKDIMLMALFPSDTDPTSESFLPQHVCGHYQLIRVGMREKLFLLFLFLKIDLF